MTHGDRKSNGRSSNGESSSINKTLGQEIIFVESNYSLLSDNFRKHTPNIIQCSIFCGGRHCRYESPDFWDSTHMAVNGIFSHWVTDDILAMARPCTDIINKKNVIKQFQSLGVKSLINLQKPGEHANCGCPLEKTGFTYDPALFMENNIYYYNFGWDDYGETPLSRILDMVKIICFGLTQGKVAIHCHAGLGRTGVLIACYLVFRMKFKANRAIMFVRLKRPNSVQTRGQIQCVQEFEQLVWSQNMTFPNKEPAKDKKSEDFTLAQYLSMQKVLLYGKEARCFRYIPKIIFVICERLLKLGNCKLVGMIEDSNDDLYETIPTTASFLAANNNVSYYQYIFAKRLLCKRKKRKLQNEDGIESNCKVSKNATIEETNGNSKIITNNVDEVCQNIQGYQVDDVVNAITTDHETINENLKRQIRQYQHELNNGFSSWKKLESETNLVVLTGLLFDWIEQLKTPILSRDYLTFVVLHYTDPHGCMKKFELVVQYTIEYLFRFLSHLTPVSTEDMLEMVKRMIASLTQQSVLVKGILMPAGKDFNKLRIGTFRVLMEFCSRLLHLLSN